MFNSVAVNQLSVTEFSETDAVNEVYSTGIIPPPPFSVNKIIPLLPAIQPLSLSNILKPNKLSDVGQYCVFQFNPPFLVCKITPVKPTAQPVESSIKSTSLKCCKVPEFCKFHVSPPSSVFNIHPFSPTAQPTKLFINSISKIFE
ncbi:MAG: hypothetical protein PHY57_04790 [Ignavibacterium sp.]|nr:hypothetical protein [Ignavibacteriaceae bacterium]MDD5607806.1 hypothetical protein [Ignavibacterium sp.]MDX9713787.1 hypothetical protein [Ignavibacteriaceae bacterium]